MLSVTGFWYCLHASQNIKAYLKVNAVWLDGTKKSSKGDRTNDKILTKALMSDLLVQLLVFYYIYEVFPTPMSTLVLVSSDLDMLHCCCTDKSVSAEARTVVNTLENVLRDKQYKWATQHTSKIEKGLPNYLTQKEEVSSLTFLLSFAQLHYLNNTYLSDPTSYLVLKGGSFQGLNIEEKDGDSINSISLQKGNSEAVYLMNLNEMSPPNCTLPAFGAHFCKPITDARGEKRSFDIKMMRRSDKELFKWIKPVQGEDSEVDEVVENDKKSSEKSVASTRKQS